MIGLLSPRHRVGSRRIGVLNLHGHFLGVVPGEPVAHPSSVLPVRWVPQNSGVVVGHIYGLDAGAIIHDGHCVRGNLPVRPGVDQPEVVVNMHQVVRVRRPPPVSHRQRPCPERLDSHGDLSLTARLDAGPVELHNRRRQRNRVPRLVAALPGRAGVCPIYGNQSQRQVWPVRPNVNARTRGFRVFARQAQFQVEVITQLERRGNSAEDATVGARHHQVGWVDGQAGVFMMMVSPRARVVLIVHPPLAVPRSPV